MKKKVRSAFVVVGLVVALLILGLKDNGNFSENETEVITQGEDVRTEVSDTVDIRDEEIPETEDNLSEENSLVTESEATETDEQSENAGQGGTNGSSSQAGNKVNTTLGNDLAHEESVASNSGVTIPVLNKFNAAGLDPDCAKDDGMQDWFGYVGDENAPGYQNVTACADVMNELTEALDISGGFLPQQDHISFSFADIYAETGDLELRRDFDNGYYTIGINYDMSDSEAFYPIEDGKDALTLLCSVISSTPTELAEFLYEESFVVEECVTSETTWVAVGDCLVQWGGYDSNGEDVLVYKVKAK